VTGSCEYSREPWSSMNGGELLYQLTVSFSKRILLRGAYNVSIVIVYFIYNNLHSIIVLIK
jgi:hypothetical protein